MFSEARNIFLILKVTSKISTIDVDIKYIKINLNIQIERTKTETFIRMQWSIVLKRKVLVDQYHRH